MYVYIHIRSMPVKTKKLIHNTIKSRSCRNRKDCKARQEKMYVFPKEKLFSFPHNEAYHMKMLH